MGREQQGGHVTQSRALLAVGARRCGGGVGAYELVEDCLHLPVDCLLGLHALWERESEDGGAQLRNSGSSATQ